MKPCYIHSHVSISAQSTFEDSEKVLKILDSQGIKVEAQHPNYRDHIAISSLRRMSTGVKMGITASKKALVRANLDMPDAVIVGSGIGCIEDTEKFLMPMLSQNEDFLTPTSFIQSTHNTVAAQIALQLKCRNYNTTYVNGASSFESALIDAQLRLFEHENQRLLVGAVDELGQDFISAMIHLDKQQIQPIEVAWSEGAHFFVLSEHRSNDCSKLLGVKTFSKLDRKQVETEMLKFLTDKGKDIHNIDAFGCGRNGDLYDCFYDELNGLGSGTIPQFNYKSYCGEYFTASAFGMWMACEMVEKQRFYDCLSEPPEKSLKTVLIYNQFKGRDHSFTPIEAC